MQGMEALYEKAIEYFNNGYFFEAHDTFEELWMDDRDEAKRFYQGLVQLSTGFYHLVMKNLKGAESQLTKGVEKLSSYPPVYHGLKVSEIISDVEGCVGHIHRARNESMEMDEIVKSIPKLKRDQSTKRRREEHGKS
jgi:hypothetical protein